MKLTVAVLLLAVAARGAEVQPASRSERPAGHTEKRALGEGNAALEKRTPVLATPVPAPGIEYVDATEAPRDRSPIQQVYAAPVPRVAKISDVLAGQGRYQAAIASHLQSPVSIYQARLSSPTTYEVSAPIPSQLAYSEKITYQPSPNAIRFTPQAQNQKVAKQNQLSQPIVLQPVYQQNPQKIYQQIPVFQQLQGQNLQFYSQVPNQAQHLSQPLPQLQPGIVYVKQEVPRREYEVVQGDSKASQLTKTLEKQATEQKFNTQQQGAMSYASFSLGFPTPSNQQLQHQSPSLLQIQQQKVQQQQQIQRVQQQTQTFQPSYQPQHHPQYQSQLFQAQVQYQQPAQYQAHLQHQIQPLPQYQSQPQHQIKPLPQYQAQPQHQIQPLPQYQAQAGQYQAQSTQYQVQPYHLQLQSQYQPQIQYHQPQLLSTKVDPSPANSISTLLKPENRPSVLIRTNPDQVFQNQFPGQLLVDPDLSQGFGGQVSVAPVQYFGKFAQAIFGRHQPQK